MFEQIKKYGFLFKQLVKRDFTRKYKRTFFGMVWSVLSPLINFFVMRMIFSNMFSHSVEHYSIYLFSGQIVYAFFSDATGMGMNSLVNNAGIFSKVNIPKYLFLFSQNVSSLINFALTLLVFFLFFIIEGMPFTWALLLLFFPIGCLIVFNTGLGLVLSALQVFFRDMQYLWGIFTQLLMWVSAIFYTLDSFSPETQKLFLLNPLYVYIDYVRSLVLYGTVPPLGRSLLCILYAVLAFGFGCFMYKRFNQEFLYYV